MDLTTLIEPTPDLPRLSQVLEELGALGRLHCVMGWERGKLSDLFEALKGFRPATLDDLFPSDIAEGKDAVYRGANSSGLFTHFEKRIAKPVTADPTNDLLWGFTQRSPGWLGGDAFVARASTGEEAAGELELDHRAVPTGAVPGWPEPSKFSATGEVDLLRALTSHIFVGRSFRASGSGTSSKLEPLDKWFGLCRIDAVTS